MSVMLPQYAQCRHCAKSIHRTPYEGIYSSWFDEEGNMCRKMTEVPVQHAPAETAHEHDFADTDTVTVKELRDASRKGNIFLPSLLAEISRSREPEYPEGAVVKDAGGKFWKRGRGAWCLLVAVPAASAPEHPLERM